MSTLRSIAMTFVACLALPTLAHAQLNVICSVPEEWCRAVAEQFDKETGIKVVLTPLGGREALALLAEQQRNPRQDVWFGGSVDTHLRAGNRQFVAEYKSPMVTQLQPWAQKVAEQSKSHTAGLYLRVLGIGYNTDLLAQKKLAPPACWKDLLKPGFAAEVQLAEGRAQSPTYAAIATLVQLLGEDEAFKYLKAIHKPDAKKARQTVNAAKSAAKSKAAPSPVKSLASISYINEVMTDAAGGAPLKAVVPCEGTTYDVGGLSIVTGAKNADNAKKFFDWALSANAQALAVKAKQFQYPANTSAPAPAPAPKFADIKFIPYDSAKFDASSERRRLLARWAQDASTGEE